ncbi:MAG: PCMD domain-containing protein [Flavobacteriales bacterium]
MISAKIYGLYLFAFCVASGLHASAQQQLVNGSFDQWENSGKWLEPVGWNGLMSADLCTFCSFGASQRVFRDAGKNRASGSSIRIESTSTVGVIVNGTVTTGRVTAPSIVPSVGYNKTVLADKNFQLQFNQRPDSLVFWAKYSISDKSDSALVSFLLHDEFEQTDPPSEKTASLSAGIARMIFQTNSQWQRISVPFIYSANGESPKYLLATFSSSFIAGKGNSKSKLWIDDVELIYNQSEQAFYAN